MVAVIAVAAASVVTAVAAVGIIIAVGAGTGLLVITTWQLHDYIHGALTNWLLLLCCCDDGIVAVGLLMLPLLVLLSWKSCVHSSRLISLLMVLLLSYQPFVLLGVGPTTLSNRDCVMEDTSKDGAMDVVGVAPASMSLQTATLASIVAEWWCAPPLIVDVC